MKMTEFKNRFCPPMINVVEILDGILINVYQKLIYLGMFCIFCARMFNICSVLETYFIFLNEIAKIDGKCISRNFQRCVLQSLSTFRILFKQNFY